MALVILFATTAPAAIAQPADPHVLFESRCGRCHGHAGDFARETLLFENGELIRQKSRRWLIDFLPNHFGNLNDDEISVLVEAFEGQIQTDGL